MLLSIRGSFCAFKQGCSLRLRPSLGVGERQVQLRCAVTGLESKSFFEFANSGFQPALAHQHRSQSAMALLERRSKADHVFEFGLSRLEVVLIQGGQPFAVGGVCLPKSGRWLLWRGAAGEEQGGQRD
jgi:hypothetical protein